MGRGWYGLRPRVQSVAQGFVKEGGGGNGFGAGLNQVQLGVEDLERVVQLRALEPESGRLVSSHGGSVARLKPEPEIGHAIMRSAGFGHDRRARVPSSRPFRPGL
jgi:hypothetical protein